MADRASQVTLKFAAGDRATRRQVSSAWYVRITRGGEIYVLNRELGGQGAHISFHKDGRCHFKVLPGQDSQQLEKVAEWLLPPPAGPNAVARICLIAIPHSGLRARNSHVEPEADTVLIPPPPPGQQIEVSLFLELGPTTVEGWPGRENMASSFVGRVSFHADGVARPLLSLSAVATEASEIEWQDRLAKANVPDLFSDPAKPPLRFLLFESVQFDDGTEVPCLMESALS